MDIPFIDLKAQLRRIEPELRARIDAVLAHGKFIMGPEVGELEEKLSRMSGARHAIACSSGTDALLMPLMAWGIGEGDAVLLPPFTFIATAEVISMIGATPVFVDIEPRTFNLDPEKLEEAVIRLQHDGCLTPRAVIPVDLFGLPCDYDAIGAIARHANLLVLEDAAQSFGAEYKGRRAGSLGDAAGISFFPSKPLGCYGDGGAVLTDDDKLAARVRSIRVHGMGTDKYDNVRIGLNGRLDTLQAAILLAKLGVFEEETEARQRVAARYTEKLRGVVDTPVVPSSSRSVWAQYSLLSEARDALQAHLKELGIPTMIYYPRPLHLQTAYAQMAHEVGDFPISESASRRVLSLPMHPYLDDAQIDVIAEAAVSYFAHARAPSARDLPVEVGGRGG